MKTPPRVLIVNSTFDTKLEGRTRTQKESMEGCQLHRERT